MKRLKVRKAKWVAIALDYTGNKAERAWALKLTCGHTVFRRVAWGGVPDPDSEPAPRSACCELCAGKRPEYRLAEIAEREHLRFLEARERERRHG